MGRFCSRGLQLAVAILSLWSISGCGSSKAGPPLFPGKITLTPNGTNSIQLGGTVAFTASAQTSAGINLNTTFTYSSTDTAVLNVAPNGVACAGHWDAAFAVCTPGGTGVVQVTASALGVSSIPTYVFVHPPIDNITVSGVLLNGLPLPGPCLSQGQSMTVEAHAFSQGSDITAAVGPFTWSARDISVVTLTPLVNNSHNFNFPTNQATATAATPGMTLIYATASGVTSTAFQQPQYSNAQRIASPALDFFETCPIQNISLEVGFAGSSQTSFVASKATAAAETVIATVTDVMGKTSLPNTDGDVVLSKIPLTWTSSQPGAIGISTSTSTSTSAASATCALSCPLATPSPGSAAITASCSPPTCNIGFPLVPPSLSSSSAIAACTSFFQPVAPSGFSCAQLIPAPVYATPLTSTSNGAISGLVTGAPSAASLLASSTGCNGVNPIDCTTATYLATAQKAPGGENPLPTSPNSMLFDPPGDKAYMGSEFGAQAINPANLGTSNSPFTTLGTVTGNVLAISNNGSVAIFSDTVHSPNQVYVVNTANASSPIVTALNISSAVAASFSPDGLNAYILGNGGSSLYIYSPLQALQGPFTLNEPGSSVAFSSNGAFAYVAEGIPTGASFNVTAYANCSNAAVAPITSVASITVPGSPLLMKVLPGTHISGPDSSGVAIPDGTHLLVLDSTGFDILTSTIAAPATRTSCPQILTFAPLQRVELGQGTIQNLVNFFASADGTLLYVAVAGNSSILVYDFSAGTVIGGIELIGNATPVCNAGAYAKTCLPNTVDMSVDAGTIMVAASDGLLHEISTALGGSDQFQAQFPNLPNYLNAFCSYSPAGCALNLITVRP